VRGFWHYARGLAEARAGRPEAALAEVRAIRTLAATADLGGLEEQYLPARDILTLASNVVEAKVAAAAGDWATAEGLLVEAIALEDGIGYMEPPAAAPRPGSGAPDSTCKARDRTEENTECGAAGSFRTSLVRMTVGHRNSAALKHPDRKPHPRDQGTATSSKRAAASCASARPSLPSARMGPITLDATQHRTWAPVDAEPAPRDMLDRAASTGQGPLIAPERPPYHE
jgi:hypothetical protein